MAVFTQQTGVVLVNIIVCEVAEIQRFLFLFLDDVICCTKILSSFPQEKVVKVQIIRILSNEA